MTIEIDPRVYHVIERLGRELPALLESGEPWEYTISRTREGKIFRKMQRNAQIEPGLAGRHASLPAR